MKNVPIASHAPRKIMARNKKYFIGRVKDYSRQKGWFFGHFMAEEALRSDAVEIAWQDISNKRASPEDAHFHAEATEINIVISGTMRLTIGGDRHSVNKGEFCIVYPHTVVSGVEADKDTELIVIKTPSVPNDKVKGDTILPTGQR